MFDDEDIKNELVVVQEVGVQPEEADVGVSLLVRDDNPDPPSERTRDTHVIR